MDTTFDDFLNSNAANTIRDLAVKKGFKEVQLKLKRGSSIGDNYVGIMVKVKVEGIKDNKKEEMDVIVKVAPVSEEARGMLPIKQMFHREIFAYSKIFPIYKDIQKSNPLDEDQMYRFPECFSINLESLQEFIIMEDLTLESYYMHEPKNRLFDFDHASIALKTLARFHGLSYILQKRNSELFLDIVGNLNEIFVNLEEPFKPFYQMFESTSAKVLTALKNIPKFELVENFLKNLYSKLGEVTKPQKYSVICHGDFWKNNMLIKYLDNRQPISVAPLDYQLMRYSSPGTDIMYFIYLCTSEPLLSEKFDELINIYHEALKTYLSKFNMNVEQCLPREELDKELLRVGFYGVGMAVCVLLFITSDGGEIREAKSVTDGHINENGPGFRLYKERLEKIFIHAIERGYIK